MNEIITDEIFKKIDFTQKPLPKGTYENCEFVNCRFNNHNLSGYRFEDCKFIDCDMSLVVFDQSSLQKVSFLRSKLTGVSFEKCNPFLLEISFEDCSLDLTSFANLSLPRIAFKNCKMIETNLSSAFLQESIFDNCDLDHAIFYKTDLTRSDLRTAFNYNIDPENNIIKDAKFTYPACKGLLSKYEVCID